MIQVSRQFLNVHLPQILMQIQVEYHKQATVKLVRKEAQKCFFHNGKSVDIKRMKILFNGIMLPEVARLKSLATTTSYVMEVFYD